MTQVSLISPKSPLATNDQVVFEEGSNLM